MHSHAIEKVRRVFQEVDTSGDGLIDLEELKSCCHKLQIEISKDDFSTFHHDDSSGDNKLNFNEFVSFVENSLRKVFDAIDVDHNHKLDAHEIQLALEKLSISVSIRKIQSMMSALDMNNDSVVDFEEFCDFFSDMPTPNLQAITNRWIGGYGLDFGADQVPAAIPPPEMPLWQFMFAGGLGGVASRTATAPLERIKILAQTASFGEKRGVINTFGNMWRKEGVRGLFAGNGTNVIRVFPTSALVCLVYSRMIKYTPVDNNKHPNQPLWRLLSGATAGAVATTLTHPLDVIRARLTVQDHSSAAVRQYHGILQSTRKIVTEEGAWGLYKGLGPTLASIAPFLAVQQCIYDVVKMQAVKLDYPCSVGTFLLCGAFAGVVAQTSVHPLDVVRRRMQVASSQLRSPVSVRRTSLSALRLLWKEGGLPKLYAGLTAAYLKVVPSAAISLLVRDAMLGRLATE